MDSKTTPAVHGGGTAKKDARLRCEWCPNPITVGQAFTATGKGKFIHLTCLERKKEKDNAGTARKFS